jgi:hypothetical protein
MVSTLASVYPFIPFFCKLKERNMPDAIKKRGILNPKRKILIYSK